MFVIYRQAHKNTCIDIYDFSGLIKKTQDRKVYFKKKWLYTWLSDKADKVELIKIKEGKVKNKMKNATHVQKLQAK